MVTTSSKRRFYIYATLLIPYSAHATQPMQEFVGIQPAAYNRITVPVKSVTFETVATPDDIPVCSQTIVSERQLAQRQEDAKPWIIKYWQPILGGVLGAAIGYNMGRYYGSTNQKWKTPTIIGGVALGALLGPGFALGAYGLGALSEHYWPTKLPLEIALSLVGGILGKMIWKALMPADPPEALLKEPAPGEYLAEQRFFLETTCFPSQRFLYEQSKYQVTYVFNDTIRTVETDYDPGSHIEIDEAGNPTPPFSSAPSQPE
jgi:uncharacterized protein YcfJ